MHRAYCNTRFIQCSTCRTPVHARWCQETARTRGLNLQMRRNPQALFFYGWRSAIGLLPPPPPTAAAAVVVLFPPQHANHGTTRRSSDCAERRGYNIFDKWKDLRPVFTTETATLFFSLFFANTPTWLVETLDPWCIMPSFLYISLFILSLSLAHLAVRIIFWYCIRWWCDTQGGGRVWTTFSSWSASRIYDVFRRWLTAVVAEFPI